MPTPLSFMVSRKVSIPRPSSFGSPASSRTWPPFKTLEAAADAGGVLFQNGDGVAGAGQDQAAFKAAQSAADYYRSLGHTVV